MYCKCSVNFHLKLYIIVYNKHPKAYNKHPKASKHCTS